MKKEFVIGTCRIILLEIFIPIMLITFFILGALHGKYQYSSGFRQNLTVNLGSMGEAFYHIYQVGESKPNKWLVISFVIIIGYLYFAIRDIQDLYHKTKYLGFIAQDWVNQK